MKSLSSSPGSFAKSFGGKFHDQDVNIVGSAHEPDTPTAAASSSAADSTGSRATL